MSDRSPLRGADARFLLPAPLESVQLLGEPPGWRAALAAAGIPVVDDDADAVVALSRDVRPAVATGAATVLLVGARGRRVLGAHGYAARVVLARHGTSGPRLLVPVDARAACRAALLESRPGRSAAKRIGTAVALTAARAGVPAVPGFVVGTRRGAQPALLEAAGTAAGVRVGSDWFVALGDGDDLQRCVWLCFEGGRPQVVVKWTRVAGNVAPFERDVDVGTLVASLPDAVRKHAVRQLARFDLGPLPAVVETAAPGRPLQDRLELGEAVDGVVDAVADWIVELGRATAGEPAELVRGLEAVRPVLQHNDLGTWNILSDGADFTVVDWESSVEAGLPLWDLAYFLTDALTAGGPREPEARADRMQALHRGEDPASGRFFARLAAAADAAGVGKDAVGPIVELAWRHHASSHERRVERLGGAAAVARGPLERLAERWRADPRLGARWPAFAEWRSAAR